MFIQQFALSRYPGRVAQIKMLVKELFGLGYDSSWIHSDFLNTEK